MKFLHPDSPLMQFLSRVADIMIVNLLFVLCSIPVVTAGAAITASLKVMQDMVLQTERGIAKRFFETFRKEFKHSTIVWLLLLLVCGILAYDALLVFWSCEKAMATAFYICLGFLAFLAIGCSIYVFSLLARYNNTLRNHMRNGFFLMISKIHRTIPAVLLSLSPIIIPVFYTMFFIKYLYLWAFLFFGIVFYCISYLLKPILLLNDHPVSEKTAEL